MGVSRRATGRGVRVQRVSVARITVLGRKAVLNAVENDTKLSSACFMTGESSRGEWEALVHIWISVYVGFPYYVATDQRWKFIYAEWETMMRASGIKPKASEVEGHNALGEG